MALPRRTKADAVLDNYAAIAPRIVVIDRGAGQLGRQFRHPAWRVLLEETRLMTEDQQKLVRSSFAAIAPNAAAKVAAVTAEPSLPEPMKRVQPEQIAGATLLPDRTQEFGASVSVNIHCWRSTALGVAGRHHVHRSPKARA